MDSRTPEWGSSPTDKEGAVRTAHTRPRDRRCIQSRFVLSLGGFVWLCGASRGCSSSAVRDSRGGWCCPGAVQDSQCQPTSAFNTSVTLQLLWPVSHLTTLLSCCFQTAAAPSYCRWRQSSVPEVCSTCSRNIRQLLARAFRTKDELFINDIITQCPDYLFVSSSLCRAHPLFFY